MRWEALCALITVRTGGVRALSPVGTQRTARARDEPLTPPGNDEVGAISGQRPAEIVALADGGKKASAGKLAC